MECKICKTKTKTILKDNFVFFKCSNCEAIYKGFSFLKEYSQNSENYKLLTEPEYYYENINSFENSLMLKWIEKYLIKESIILDIGCSNGAFLKALNKKGYKEVYGVDIQNQIVEFANKKGCNCYISEYPKNIPNKFENLKFDLITSFENIYYMEDVVEFFKVSSHLLNGGEDNVKI